MKPHRINVCSYVYSEYNICQLFGTFSPRVLFRSYTSTSLRARTVRANGTTEVGRRTQSGPARPDTVKVWARCVQFVAR